MAQAKTVGPTSEAGQRATEQAAAQVSAANFQAAAPVLAAHQAQNGTYAGAVLPPSFGVALVRADASSYCLQAGTGGAVLPPSFGVALVRADASSYCLQAGTGGAVLARGRPRRHAGAGSLLAIGALPKSR